MTRRDVIAIGGSLGAVEAVRELCRSFAADFAAGIAVVIHVGAHGNNLLTSIFQQETTLPVATASDGERMQTGHVYIAPADHHLLVIDGIIRLGRGPRENLARPAIDPLFRSAGMSYGHRAIGVVLTGLLTDGASGLAAIKRCGGVTVVQNPSDAQAPDMPLEALQSSVIDYRAPLRDLGALLATLTAQEAGPPVPVPADIPLEVDIALGRPSTTDGFVLFGEPVALFCPACGGVLSQARHGPVLRFRCQVGHAYTADTLSLQKEGSVDEAMRVALRIIEERAVLTGKMADEAKAQGRHHVARTVVEHRTEYRQQAGVLRQAILGANR